MQLLHRTRRLEFSCPRLILLSIWNIPSSQCTRSGKSKDARINFLVFPINKFVLRGRETNTKRLFALSTGDHEVHIETDHAAGDKFIDEDFRFFRRIQKLDGEHAVGQTHDATVDGLRFVTAEKNRARPFLRPK